MPVSRCVYPVKGGKQCASPGKGTPPLCPKHKKLYVEPINPFFAGLVNALLDQPVTKAIVSKVDGVLNKATNAFNKIAEGDFSELNSLLRKGAKPTVEYGGATQEDPRTVLGFKMGEPITKAKIKERQRELAKLFHPDKGGSDEAMQRVNAAADILLKEIK